MATSGVFDTYSAERVTVRKELDQGYNNAWTNVLSHHVALLLSMLKHQVLHHSFTAATATMATVSMAMDRVPVVMYRAGVGVLAQSSEGYRETLQLLKLLFTWKPKYQVSLLLETALFIAAHDNLQEAYDTLQSQIHNDGFKSNAMIHGCSAVIQYLMWRKEAWHEGVSSESGVWHEGGANERAGSLSKKALLHFKTLEELDAVPSYHMDTFISVHSQLLCELGRHEEALKLLLSYRDSNHGDGAPPRTTAARLVSSHVRQHCADKNMLTQHLWKLVASDDSCEEALELAAILCQGWPNLGLKLFTVEPLIKDTLKEDNPPYKGQLENGSDSDDGIKLCEKVFQLLVNFLDYPHNRTSSMAWTLLQQVQHKWPRYQYSDLWTLRMDWWHSVQD